MSSGSRRRRATGPCASWSASGTPGRSSRPAGCGRSARCSPGTWTWCCRSAAARPGPSPATGRCASTRSSRGGAPSGSTGCCPSTWRTATRRCSPTTCRPARSGRSTRSCRAPTRSRCRRGNVARNPCKLVEPPRLGQARKKALTEAQARAVLAAVAERRNSSRWSVGLACGLRQGEALGLRWPFVDLDAGGDAGLVAAAAAAVAPWLRRCREVRRGLAPAAVPAELPEGGPQVRAAARVHPGRRSAAVQAGMHRARGAVPAAPRRRPGVPRDQGTPPQDGGAAARAGRRAACAPPGSGTRAA